MGKIRPPQSPLSYNIEIDKFLGADLTNAPSYVSPFRSPYCPNMIRESTGKVRKWIGWHTVKKYDARINGFHTYSDEKGDRVLIHSGTNLYFGDTVIYSQMNDERSASKQLNGKLIIADGKKLLMYYKKGEDFICEPVENNAYVPKIVISRKPTGGGTTYEPINLLSKQRKDSFLGTEGDKTYQLSSNNIESVDKVEKLNSSGGWDDITDYSVDKVSGKVTFSTAPGVSAITGQDNLIITYSKSVKEYAEKINSRNIMTLFGVNGAMDRIFLAGDGNRDYYCQMDDPTYWGDLFYCIIGQDNSKIMGYSIINDKLATHIDHSDNDTNIILRTGSLLDDGSASFTLTGSFTGSGAISKYAFSTLETEPLFITNQGILAVTPSDVLGERYAQLRSYYLNGLLLKQDLSKAVACTFDRFYMLAVGGYLFALDGTQSSNERNTPYSSRQYEGFYRTNVDARCIANINNTLIFGTNDGKICRFYKDYSELKNFSDDGEPILAKWTTPEISGRDFASKKRFKTVCAMIGSAIATGVRISAIYDGVTEEQADYDNSARYFSFSQLTFSKVCFKTDKTAYILKEKISIKPDSKKAQFVFENGILNEPLALYNANIEFTESR